jgi:hypothetical protein
MVPAEGATRDSHYVLASHTCASGKASWNERAGGRRLAVKEAVDVVMILDVDTGPSRPDDGLLTNRHAR